MTIQDTQIYHLESIRDEMNELLDEAEAIVASTDDYVINDRAKARWLTTIRNSIHSKTSVVTMSTTIDELWEDWYDNVYEGEE